MPITKLQKPFKYFSILRPMKNDVRFEYAHGKMSDFISFPLFRFTLVMKLKKKMVLKVIEMLWYFFIKKLWPQTWICLIEECLVFFHFSFPWFGFALVIKLRNFYFESHWNTLIIFYQRNDVRFEYVLQSSAWFGFSFLFWVLIFFN